MDSAVRPSRSARSIAASTTSSTVTFCLGPRRAGPSSGLGEAVPPQQPEHGIGVGHGAHPNFFVRRTEQMLRLVRSTPYTVRHWRPRCHYPPPIEARGLRKRYGDTFALDGFDLDVSRRLGARAPRAERRRQEHGRPHLRHADPHRRGRGPRRRVRRPHPARAGALGDRPGRAVGGARRDPPRTREPRDVRPPARPRPPPRRRRAPPSCWRRWTSPTRRTARCRPTPAACGAGSTSPPRSSPDRRCCSSTSRRPGSTRAGGPTSGTPYVAWSRWARRCCSPRSTSRRPTGSPTGSR